MTEKHTLLQVNNVSRTFRNLGQFFSGRRYDVHAVQSVSLNVNNGEIVGLVGESGSGKSTLARMIVGLDQPDHGQIILNKRIVNDARGETLRWLRRAVQMVFQNPYAALDPLQRIDSAIIEPLCNVYALPKTERIQKAEELLDEVGLPSRLMLAYPHQLSGGERQRVCIARALSVRPQLLICDEAVSSLDKTVQAQVLSLLRKLQQRHQLTILFISHDLAAVNMLCDRVAVMQHGKIIETGSTAQMLATPIHAYTKALLNASRYLECGESRDR
jgi:ABC-type oligopeptide transport system ATPase subunit